MSKLHSIIVPPAEEKKIEKIARDVCIAVLKRWGLTYRQAEVASYLLEAKSNQEIADALFVVEKTVKFHFTEIYKTMHVKNRMQCLNKIHAILAVPREK
jgi:DNA-binding NarL/FixJ family response regulator